MNFNKYHVSRNLFDDFDIIGQVPSVSNGNLVNSVFGGTTSFIQMDNTEIVLSYNAVGQIYLFLYDNDFQFIGYARTANGNPIYSASITGYSDAVYCRVRADNLSTFSNANIMLNTGSQPLPYEPYSSEVWHDTPHYIHKTSTDTITTLPAVIYPNTATATVGLKGNMSQTGTPTPTTPIQPSECGERTANLFDISKVVPNVNVTNQGDSLKITTPSTTTSVVAGSPYTLQTYCPNLQVGDVATLSFVSTGSSKYIYLQGENITWVSGQSKTITSAMLSSAVLWYASGVSTEAIISNVILNLGSTPLPYEPYGYFIEIEVS